ncbi:MAG: hypothetical protein JOZ39_11455 [Chloroflexi bacterium]|nr:hypothetical protein [Chloroflexota bacterium]
MYVSRLSFNTVPGKGHEAGDRLGELASMIERITGARPRVLRTHFGALGEADFELEQDVATLADLEAGLQRVTANEEFRHWSANFSTLLLRSPQRQILEKLA